MVQVRGRLWRWVTLSGFLFALLVGAASPSQAAVDCTLTPTDPACIVPAPTPTPVGPQVVTLDETQFALLGGAAGLLVFLSTASLVSSWGLRRG